MQSYFVTANDTGVGKTYTCGVLARHFASQGKSVQIIKAIDCGGSGDAEWALRFADLSNVTAHTLVQFPQPLAPTTQDPLREEPNQPEKLRLALQNLAPCDVRLVEGAGGLAVPLDTAGHDWRDFIDALNPTRTLVVVDNRLGAINQARLLHSYCGDRPHCFILNTIDELSPEVNASNQAAYAQLALPLFALLKKGQRSLEILKAELLKPEIKNPPKSKPTCPKFRLDMRRKKGTLRKLRVVEDSKGTLNLANNDYLNLRKNGRLAQAANEATLRYGASASASPLITGYTAIHAALEAEIRDWYAMPQALLWNSGYAANQAVLSLIIQPGDLVLADRLIHNSLISGILKSKARLIRFPHNDLEALESLLKCHAGRTIHLVTESVYSMDGDYPDLKKIAALKKTYGFTWFLDEAHATGWYGNSGAGLAQEIGVLDSVDILTGTLGKSLATSGAYTLFHEAWQRELCINEASEFIYSTYFPPANAASALAAIQLLRQRDPAESGNCRKAAASFRDALRKQGWQVLGVDSAVVPVICGASERTMNHALDLLKAGIRVAAIRPPTVAEGSARLRLSLKSSLQTSDYSRLLKKFTQLNHD